MSTKVIELAGEMVKNLPSQIKLNINDAAKRARLQVMGEWK